MNSETLRQLYGINYQALKANTGGIDHEESLITPEGGGNCLNWVLGHIVASRNNVLILLDEEPLWSSEIAAAYDRGAKPFENEADILPLDRILTDLDRSQEILKTALDRLTPERSETKTRFGTLGEALLFFHFHEAYHCGQTGLLRRMAGKKGAIP